MLLRKGFKALCVVGFVVQCFKPRLLHTGVAEILVCAFYRVFVRFKLCALLWGFLRGFCFGFTLYLCGLLSLLWRFLLGLCGGFGFLPCGGFLCSLFLVKQLDVCLLVRFFFRAFTAVIQVSDALEFLLYGKVAVFNRFDSFLCGIYFFFCWFFLRRSNIKLVKHFLVLYFLFGRLLFRGFLLRLCGGFLLCLSFRLHISRHGRNALCGACRGLLNSVGNHRVKLCFNLCFNNRVLRCLITGYQIVKQLIFCPVKFCIGFCIACIRAVRVVAKFVYNLLPAC